MIYSIDAATTDFFAWILAICTTGTRLLSGDACLDKNHRFQKKALIQCATRCRKPSGQQGTRGLLHAILNIDAHVLELLLITIASSRGIAYPEGAKLGDQSPQEGVINAGTKKEARASHTCLSLTREAHRGDDPIHNGRIIGKDNGGALSSEASCISEQHRS